MESLDLDPAVASRLDRLAVRRGGGSLRRFAVWCGWQCLLNRQQACILRQCIIAQRQPADRAARAFASIREAHLQRQIAATLIGMKYEPVQASATVTVIAAAHPNAREAASQAATFARMHAGYRAIATDAVHERDADHAESAHASVECSTRAVRLWADATAMGDQCDQLDRMLGELA
jgi:hypothetical protein